MNKVMKKQKEPGIMEIIGVIVSVSFLLFLLGMCFEMGVNFIKFFSN